MLLAETTLGNGIKTLPVDREDGTGTKRERLGSFRKRGALRRPTRPEEREKERVCEFYWGFVSRSLVAVRRHLGDGSDRCFKVRGVSEFPGGPTASARGSGRARQTGIGEPIGECAGAPEPRARRAARDPRRSASLRADFASRLGRSSAFLRAFGVCFCRGRASRRAQQSRPIAEKCQSASACLDSALRTRGSSDGRWTVHQRSTSRRRRVDMKRSLPASKLAWRASTASVFAESSMNSPK